MTSHASMSDASESKPSSHPRYTPPAPSSSAYNPRFRFKGESSRHRKRIHQDEEPSHRHRHGDRTRRRTRTPSPSSRAHKCARSRSPDPPPRELSPNTAFRESLFDAMADDEGAAYWEAVYGQPVHIYPPPNQSGETYEGGDYNNPDVLDADAYAAYVRRKMWEKSHEHILEERARRDAEAEKRRLEREQELKTRREYKDGKYGYWDDFRRRRGFGQNTHSSGRSSEFADELEAGLRRGEKRREEKKWKSAWTGYMQRWDGLLENARPVDRELKGDEEQEEAHKMKLDGSKAQLPWPVLSGKEQDVNPDAVREFFRRTPTLGFDNTSKAESAHSLRTQLKLERVRWHPDKIMQRFSVDERTLQVVTAVFQVVDQMWNEEKGTV